MDTQMRTFGYICPKCGKSVMGSRSVFALEAGGVEITCDCGESALRASFDGRDYQIHVPCAVCGGVHRAVCQPDRVLRGAAALGCSETKQFCCFSGPEGIVEKNLRDLAILTEKEKQQTAKQLLMVTHMSLQILC